jgi:energy-converting hydrogenase Eha subunit F
MRTLSPCFCDNFSLNFGWTAAMHWRMGEPEIRAKSDITSTYAIFNVFTGQIQHYITPISHQYPNHVRFLETHSLRQYWTETTIIMCKTYKYSEFNVVVR